MSVGEEVRDLGSAAAACGLILTLFAGAAGFAAVAFLLGARDRMRWRRLPPAVREALETEDWMRR